MKAERGENQIFLRGYIHDAPRFSHESHGTEYDTFPLSVPRQSGTEDHLNILVPRSTLSPLHLTTGDKVELLGEVRSYTNRSGVGSRLIISVLARAMTKSDGPPANDLTLTGALCKPPNYRRTPLGRDICDLLLAVNRRYDGRADYLPCIAWGSLAFSCRDLPVGSRLHLEGRLQSRIYYKDEQGESVPHTAFEISAMTITLSEL